MKKNLYTIPCVFVLLMGCQESKKDAASSLIESTIKAATGNEIDVSNLSPIEDNRSVVSLILDGENIGDQFTNGFGSIIASQESIAITISGGDNGQENILIGFTGKDLIATHPIKGHLTLGENEGFNFSITRAKENTLEVLISYEAEGEILTLQPEKTVIKIKGKIGSSTDAGDLDNWKPYEGTITLFHPVLQALGSEIDDYVY